jgi:hypothetical protein
VYLVDRTGMFKISHLVSGGEVIVTNLYRNLEEQRQREGEWRGEKTSKTPGDDASYDTGTALRKWDIRKKKAFKILTVEPANEQCN